MVKKIESRTRKPTKRTPKRAQKPRRLTTIDAAQTAARIHELADDVLRALAPLVRGAQPEAPIGPFRSVLITVGSLHDVAHYIAPEVRRESAVAS
ncbi:MAG: hypothetical protein IPM35_20390 [Myxococcales bacterium]|nr:hypothetical protein [Myxococcales bacterium]